MSTHTPGPLRTQDSISSKWDELDDCAIVDERGRIIGEAFALVGQNEHRPARANAELWAAAPDTTEALARTLTSLGRCQADPLNPCWNDRPADEIGKHWGGGEACSYCWGRAALKKARGK